MTTSKDATRLQGATAAMDPPLRRLEQTLDGLRRSALQTARLYETRAEILTGPSEVDAHASAKRWMAVADQTGDLQDTLRAVARRSSPSARVDDRAHQQAALVVEHLHAASLELELMMQGAHLAPDDAELALVMQELQHALRVMGRLATQ